ncbi:MAG: hypothetical protein ACR2IT_05150, partial [Pirellulales bacterium]
MIHRTSRWLASCWCLTAIVVTACQAGWCRAAEAVADRPRLFVHYMPWFAAPPVSPSWGWHWTMDSRDPDRVVAGRPEIAARHHPLIGPYDSLDESVVEYHLLLMRLAGVDGLIIDWYGRGDYRDHAFIHRAAELVVARADAIGLEFAVCYEDRTIPDLVAAGVVLPEKAVDHAAAEIGWLRDHWFPLPGHAAVEGRPVLLSFGHRGLSDDQWTDVLSLVGAPVAYFSQGQRRAAAIGGFDWPAPQRGEAAAAEFRQRARDWPACIPVAYPRFDDYYADAG